MRWLFITNTGNRNPGDEWIRIGVQRLVSEVDGEASYVLRNKEMIEDQEQMDFDRAIWCGSPLFWSHEHQGCWENYWWRTWIDGWLFKDPRKVLVLGVGNVLGKAPHDPDKYRESIETVRSKCWRVVTRQKVSDDDRILISCCPSIFALAGSNQQRSLKICTLMEDGAHDAFLDEDEANKWSGIKSKVSAQLLDLGFRLVCHAVKEAEHASLLGWPKDRIFQKPTTAEEYLSVYAKANCYVGNRMHGAMLPRAFGSPSMAIGFDSRLGMVELVGGQTCRPSQWTEKTIPDWMAQVHDPYDWKTEYDKQLALVRDFAK